MTRTEHSQPAFRVRSRRTQPPPRRGGMIAFELLLMLPILLIFLAAVVEFGLILSMVQSVEAANRYGAKLVSERSSGAAAVNFANSGNLRAAINRQLRVAGMQRGVCRLRVEHNGPTNPTNGGDAPSRGACDCVPPGTTLPVPTTAIRLTICVPLKGNVPDLLGTFGFSLNGRVIQQSSVFRLE